MTKLSGQPAAIVAYFVFVSLYVTLIYQAKPMPEHFEIIFFLLTGWFFSNSITWQIDKNNGTLFADKCREEVEKMIKKETDKWEHE